MFTVFDGKHQRRHIGIGVSNGNRGDSIFFDCCNARNTVSGSTCKAIQPFGNSTLVTVFDRKLISRFSVFSSRSNKGSQPSLNIALIAVFHSKLISGFSILAVFTARSTRTNKRNQPLGNRSFVAVFHSKFIGRKTVLALFPCVAVFTHKRIKPFHQSSFKPVLTSKFESRLTVASRSTRRSNQNSQPFLFSTLVAVVHRYFVRRFARTELFSGKWTDPLYNIAFISALHQLFVNFRNIIGVDRIIRWVRIACAAVSIKCSITYHADNRRRHADNSQTQCDQCNPLVCRKRFQPFDQS